MEKIIVLVDMDGVLADFEGKFNRLWVERYPDIPLVTPEQRNTFYLVEQYHPDHRSLVWNILLEDGFARDFNPIEGALEAIDCLESSEMVRVVICTSPLSRSNTNEQDKKFWVRKHLGDFFANKRLIITPDKTLVYGHYLVDDKQKITGLVTPYWSHKLFAAPYNINTMPKESLFCWHMWPELLLF